MSANQKRHAMIDHHGLRLIYLLRQADYKKTPVGLAVDTADSQSCLALDAIRTFMEKKYGGCHYEEADTLYQGNNIKTVLMVVPLEVIVAAGLGQRLEKLPHNNFWVLAMSDRGYSALKLIDEQGIKPGHHRG